MEACHIVGEEGTDGCGHAYGLRVEDEPVGGIGEPSVASRAQKIDTTRLRNQNELTQTAEAGGDDCREPNWAEKRS